MKKLLTLLLALAMTFALAACGGQDLSANSANSDKVSEGTENAGAENTDSDSDSTGDVLKIGYIYIGDDSEAYTENFIYAQQAVETAYAGQVETMAKYRVAEDSGEVTTAAEELIDAGCTLIFSTSFGFGETLKELAASYPNVEFCQATCADADDETPNYHNAMGEIYQGRYIAGVVAGMKLQELLDSGEVTEAKVGYVAAYPYAEVISGYTAFLMGVRSVVSDATMDVMYANSWGDYEEESKIAQTLIERGCAIISQHSDTEGPATVCEKAAANGTVVYHVGYNTDMSSFAPNTSLISSRIVWDSYQIGVVQAVLNGDKIAVDEWHGFDEGWVAMTDLNTAIAAEGTQDKIDELVDAFASNSLSATDIYVGDYTATNPWDDTDTIDLSDGYAENSTQSAPSFYWVLDNIITVVA